MYILHTASRMCVMAVSVAVSSIAPYKLLPAMSCHFSLTLTLTIFSHLSSSRLFRLFGVSHINFTLQSLMCGCVCAYQAFYYAVTP